MNEYDTSIIELKCSCGDWKERRYSYPLADPRRLCKHIINKLDIVNLPVIINYYKTSIQYYKEKEYGFPTNFEKIIHLPINDLKILFTYEWMNIYDNKGSKYGFLIEQETSRPIWSNNNKPEGFIEVEEYFNIYSENIHSLEDEEIDKISINDLNIEFSEIPTALLPYEKTEVIKLIKEEVPILKDELIKIKKDDSYLPSIQGIFYKIRPMEFEIDNIIVYHEKIEIKMWDGKVFKYKRDREKLIEGKIEQEKARLRGLKRDLGREERKRERFSRKLEPKRQKALEEGYLLAFDCNLDDDNKIYLSGERKSDYLEKRGKELSKYKTTKELLNSEIQLTNFNKVLNFIGFIDKPKNSKSSNWFLRKEYFNYGMNFELDTDYVYLNPQESLISTIFSKKSIKFEQKTTNIKKTKILWKIERFEEVLNIYKEQESKLSKQIKDIALKKEVRASEIILERELWIKDTFCPHCSSNNIHKKDKRKRKNGYIQRFQCIDCKKIFQKPIE